MSSPTPAPERPPAAGGGRRLALWAALVLLLGVAQSLLVWLSIEYESGRAQEEAERAAIEAVAAVKRQVARSVQELQALTWLEDAETLPWQTRARNRLQANPEILNLELRDEAMQLTHGEASPLQAPVFALLPRIELLFEAATACEAARRASAPAFSRSYFVPTGDGQGKEVIDLCLPRQAQGKARGYVVATFSLLAMLEAALPQGPLARHELSFVEGDGARLVRAGAGRGAGVYLSERVVDLPGRSLQLRADSSARRPSLIPNLTLALVLGLSLALFAVVLLLAYDVRRRARVEAALAESLAFRKAMEDSLSTGLRARDLEGRITYANPAFCAMVGYSADELRQSQLPPYWPPENAAEYAARQSVRLSQAHTGPGATRQGTETVFMRRGGERFPVMIYEAPLVDGQGRHTGWMSAVLDVSEQRRVEDLSRQQQERLQASARLATMGEMASLLSHELNQPLSAIASYAAGSLNLVDEAGPQTLPLLREAFSRIGDQAERAGRVIKSVHDFVRRREQFFEPIAVDRLIETVMPLMRLQARKSGARIETTWATPVPSVRCDRTMVEQVLLNLARNGIQAMEAVPLDQRLLSITVERVGERWVRWCVTDAGVGIDADVAQRLFQPFYSTRPDGMGLGLSLCRTVIEQHGGALEFESPWPAGAAGGTQFRFTLAAAGEPRGRAAAAAPGPATATSPPTPPFDQENAP